MILVAIIGFLAFIIFTRPSVAEDIDPRVPTFTTGVTVGPFHGGNSWPHTGVGVAIPFQHRSDDGTVGKFMDWRALQAHRAHAAAVSVLESLHFAFDSAEIAQRYETDLDFVARILLDNPEVSLTLAGHTDLVGTDAYNDVLADRRADSVLNALVERGVPAERLTTTGFGESAPTELILGPSITNRRVEVVPTLDLP
jgi:outer membrane protein OmpA-like peptidoglycan-associated protein